jgi:hypothetical protein
MCDTKPRHYTLELRPSPAIDQMLKLEVPIGGWRLHSVGRWDELWVLVCWERVGGGDGGDGEGEGGQ